MAAKRREVQLENQNINLSFPCVCSNGTGLRESRMQLFLFYFKKCLTAKNFMQVSNLSGLIQASVGVYLHAQNNLKIIKD